MHRLRIFLADAHRDLDGCELPLRYDADGFYGADGDALQIDRCANLQAGRILKIGDEGNLSSQEAARVARHQEYESRERGQRNQHQNADFKLRPLDFLLARHRPPRLTPKITSNFTAI